MKRHSLSQIVVLIFFLTVFSALPIAEVRAEEAMPVYIVDMNRVMRESIAGKAAINDIESERSKKQASLGIMQREAQELAEAIKKQGAVLSSSALQEKQDALERKKRDLARAAQDAEAELIKKHRVKLDKVIEQINSVVNEIAKEKKCKFIFDNDPRVVIYASDRLQMTEEVIERFNESKLNS